VGERSLHLGEWRLSEAPLPAAELRHVAAEQHGLEAGDWDPFGEPADLPPDQRGEDGLCLTFTSDPLEEPVDLLGVPVARLAVAVDRPAALVVVRLCDVDPDGRSLLVTRGLLNLTHRDGHDRALPCVPGEEMTVDLTMKAIGQRIPAGHRVRLAVSTGYWPWAWPSPAPVRLTLFTARSALVLPVRPPRAEDGHLRRFAPPELAPRPAAQLHAATRGDHTIERSLAAGEFALEHRYPHLRFTLPESGIAIERFEPDRFTIRAGDPLSARVRCQRRFAVGRPGTEWDVRLELQGEMAADAERFQVWTSLRAYDGEACAFTRAWSFQIPRAGA
jgi:hypothetical protein